MIKHNNKQWLMINNNEMNNGEYQNSTRVEC